MNRPKPLLWLKCKALAASIARHNAQLVLDEIEGHIEATAVSGHGAFPPIVQLFIKWPNRCTASRRSSAEGMFTAGNLSRQCHGLQASITARLLV